MDDYNRMEEHSLSIKITELLKDVNTRPVVAIRALCKRLGAAIGNPTHKDDRLKVFEIAAQGIKNTIDDYGKFEQYEKSKEGKNV
jgi:hypothetical protein